jgi:hypothetical protein
MKKIFWFLILNLVLIGCSRDQPLMTASDEEEQEVRMRQLLEDTSPRNMNDIPKAVPEFKKTYNLNRPGEEVPPDVVVQPTEKERPTADGDH